MIYVVIWILSNLMHGDSPSQYLPQKWMCLSGPMSNKQSLKIDPFLNCLMFHWDLSKKKVLYQHTKGLQHHFPESAPKLGLIRTLSTCQLVADFTPKKPGAGWAQYQNRVQLSIGAGLSPFLTKNHRLFDGIYPVAWRKSTWRCSSCLWDHQIELIKKVPKNSLDIFSST